MRCKISVVLKQGLFTLLEFKDLNADLVSQMGVSMKVELHSHLQSPLPEELPVVLPGVPSEEQAVADVGGTADRNCSHLPFQVLRSRHTL